MLALSKAWILLFGVAAVVLIGIVIAIRRRRRQGG